MTQQTYKAKPSTPRGAKILIASLSVAATLSGWAWLTLNPPPVESDTTDALGTTEPNTFLAPAEYTLNAASNHAISALPVRKLPDLRTLPVRGLREVGDTPIMPQVSAPPEYQASAPRERNNNGGGNQVQAPPQNSAPPQNVAPPPAPRQPPPPPPKPPRKTKPSK